ncbi:MAG: hypothetical protein ACI9AR_000432 [Flavobacteriaceae bacterium]|jgi:hypothetical protein
MKKNKNLIISLIVVAVLIFLSTFVSNNTEQKIVTWADTTIPCLPNGHQGLASHIHPYLIITVDGVNEGVLGNMGVSQTCMAEVHTHDASGKIHIETTELGVTHVLADFFEVTGGTFDRDGYTAVISVDGEVYEGDASTLVMEDNQKIHIEYTSIVE